LPKKGKLKLQVLFYAKNCIEQQKAHRKKAYTDYNKIRFY